MIEKDVLKKLYIDDKLSISSISKMTSISSSEIFRSMKRFNIGSRSRSEARNVGIKSGRVYVSEKQRQSARINIEKIRNINPEKRSINQSLSQKELYANGLKPWNKDKGKIKDPILLARRRRIESSWWDEIKLRIKARDNNSCQNCGRTDIKLDVHHIDMEENHQDYNLITLCCVCHKDVHKGKIKLIK